MERNPKRQHGATSPAHGGTALDAQASDSVDLIAEARGLYIGSGGTIKVTTRNGDVLTFIGLQTGTVLPIYVTRLWSASLTASGIIGFY